VLTQVLEPKVPIAFRAPLERRRDEDLAGLGVSGTDVSGTTHALERPPHRRGRSALLLIGGREWGVAPGALEATWFSLDPPLFGGESSVPQI